jgi:hypothetical protein
MDDTIPAGSSQARDVARQVNLHIAEMAEALDAFVKDELPIGFFCECGCLGSTEDTLADFRAAGGAWITGHYDTKPAES